MIEEAILADPDGMGRRRERADGTKVDLTGYDSHGLLVAFRLTPGAIEFVALAVWG